ncbi:MAG: hypothetical protein J5J06_07915 [Phycisphaerae bacterium]|nr:hypothetical protein [Phycisphaerae bacterium]
MQARALLGVVILLAGSGCNFDSVGGESDVPCFDTPEWQVVLSAFAVRKESVVGDVLLLTAQQHDQAITDGIDGTQDFIPHLAVYRFDPATGTAEIVDDAVWDNAEPAATGCCTSLYPNLPFSQDGTQLFFDGNLVPVTGGKLLKTSQAPTDAAEAVLSTNGSVDRLYPRASGQHFHQIFSRLDGTALGPAKRLGMGGLEFGVVFFQWTDDEKYVVYRQRTGDLPGIGRVCIVAVTEELPAYPEQ